jgi:hypothetical protein
MAAFGTVFMPHMAFTTFENNQWNEATIVASASNYILVPMCCIIPAPALKG